MFIRFFKHNYFIQFIGLLILGFALWINVFVSPPPIVEKTLTTPFYNLFASSTANHFLLILLAFIIILSEAIYLNYILIKHELIKRNSFIAAFIFLVLLSHSVQLQHLYPALISHLFVLTAFDAMLQIDIKDEYLRLVYKTGFYVGIASLFYLPAISLIVLIWMSLFIYRISSWRPWIVPLLGLLTPYLFLFTYYFWMDEASIYLIAYLDYFSGLKLLFSGNDGYEQVIMTILVFFIAISFIRVMSRLGDKKIMARKKVQVTFYFFMIGFIILFLNNGLIIHASTIYIPVSVFLAIYFTDLNKIFWTDLLFSLLVVFIIFTHFQY